MAWRAVLISGVALVARAAADGHGDEEACGALVEDEPDGTEDGWIFGLVDGDLGDEGVISDVACSARPEWCGAINAIIGMGIAAGGTNHSKVSGSLRSLATYYAKEPGVLFAVRLAQGLTHAGKGLVTLSPHHPDSSGGVCHPVALASLLVTMHVCMDFKTIVLGKHHFLLWTLVGAMRPRMLVTVDEELKPLPAWPK